MDLQQLFIHDTTFSFGLEIVLRCMLMYLLIIVFLRLTGKRGVRQLSIFEVAILLALGSISGDPMFDADIPILQALLVMSVVIVMYRLTTFLMMKYQPFEDLIEGKALYIVEDGMLVLDQIRRGKMSHDEFFAEMRQQGVEHLGQVRVALLESDGKLSLLFYPDHEVRYGLALFPKAIQPLHKVHANVQYACTYCGFVSILSTLHSPCLRCGCTIWSEAINPIRVT
ncbi:DUF421 domain-containing protein [Acinetobacter sp.]|uniref:DUF421 domain-containing protein n=1 Tax=Acinetobacter sp. TaxID=472 RepID=UPI00388DCACF